MQGLALDMTFDRQVNASEVRLMNPVVRKVNHRLFE